MLHGKFDSSSFKYAISGCNYNFVYRYFSPIAAKRSRRLKRAEKGFKIFNLDRIYLSTTIYCVKQKVTFLIAFFNRKEMITDSRFFRLTNFQTYLGCRTKPFPPEQVRIVARERHYSFYRLRF